MGDYLTEEQLAELFHKRVGTLRNWRGRGDGPPSFKAGGTVLYDLDEVRAWVEAQKSAEAARRAVVVSCRHPARPGR